MAFSNTAVFVIDIQHDLVGEASTEIPEAAKIHEAGTGILAAIRDQSAASEKPTLIVFVQHEEGPEDGRLVKGSKPWELVFKPKEGSKQEVLVPKTTRGTFDSNPDLASELRRYGIQNVIVFGVQSECCVQATCQNALDAGFGVTVLSGAHSTYNTKEKTAEQLESAVEELLSSQGAKVVKWEDAVAQWKATGVIA
ncbi:isochorismatase hydrolase [Paramyrothecium foliicola]|nr:isochorismatase hydrolase [Paramyrothecium foliicola]